MHLLVAPLALVFERLFGYPQWLVAAIGHPVIWIGTLIGWADRRFNRPADSFGRRRLLGVVMVTCLVVGTGAIAWLIQFGLRGLPGGFVLEALLAGTLLAQHELRRAVVAVADALGRSLGEGQQAVGHIVGRDTAVLDEPGVARAAVESLAESSSDAVVAPLFWLVLFGLPGIAVYKAVNTADSMVGHLSDRHRAFGWASARLDDLLNLVPARLTALIVAGAAFLRPGAHAERAWSTALRDARKHESPNAGWPEAAMAGALGISLGGPRAYGGETIDLPAFGDGRRDLGPADIRDAVVLYDRMLDLTLALAVLAALVAGRVAG